ncbi:MAG: hypothetical protein ACRDAS_11850 [Cetobacterium sp.]
MNKLVTFYSFDSEEVMKMKKLSGLTQYEFVDLKKLENIVGAKKYTSIYKTLKELEAKEYLDLNENTYRYTKKGIFWGNNISALLVEK